MKTLAAITLMTLIACSSKNPDENLNAQAILLHNSMMKKANEIERALADFEKNSRLNMDSVKVLRNALEQWEAEIVEVPGNENHDHEAQHHHDHKPLDVTAEQMLAIQKDFDLRLSSIEKRITRLLAQER
jgi:hypothetical protein